jgi:hypothetical protein
MCANLTLHQDLAWLDIVLCMQLRRGRREAQPLKQAPGAPILSLEHGSNGTDVIMLAKLGKHRFHRSARETAAPVGPRQFISD